MPMQYVSWTWESCDLCEIANNSLRMKYAVRLSLLLLLSLLVLLQQKKNLYCLIFSPKYKLADRPGDDGKPPPCQEVQAWP